MIAPDVISEIRRLLSQEHVSQREAARRTGVSRGTVNAVASNRRAEPRSLRGLDDDFPAPTGPWVRCPTCGGKVLLPCVACRVRAIADRRREGPALDAPRIAAPLRGRDG